MDYTRSRKNFSGPQLGLGVVIAVAAALIASAASPSGAPGIFGVASAEAACKGSAEKPSRLSPARAATATGCLINKKRSKHGLRRLKMDGSLEKAARAHTRRMQKQRCYAHQCPGEVSLGGRLERTSYLPCGCSWGAGETLAFGRGKHGSPRRIVRAWMRSDVHRNVILGSSFKHVGIGVRRGTPAKRSKRAAATYTLNTAFRR